MAVDHDQGHPKGEQDQEAASAEDPKEAMGGECWHEGCTLAGRGGSEGSGGEVARAQWPAASRTPGFFGGRWGGSGVGEVDGEEHVGLFDGVEVVFDAGGEEEEVAGVEIVGDAARSDAEVAAEEVDGDVALGAVGA